MSDTAGTIASLWRYPVKSMQGEEINASFVTERGLFGDRAYALMDAEDGKTVTAKNPKKWPTMFRFRAAFLEPAADTQAVPPVRITTPAGETLTSEQPDLNQALSQTLGRAVVFTSQPPEKPHLDEYWPDQDDVPGLPHSDAVTDENTLENTFFDLAILHLLTTATIDTLRAAYPPGRFEARRFRPNIVVNAGAEGFVENDWIGKTLAIGDEVRLAITGPCPRCVMTTLPQADLPKDPGILRTAVQQNGANVGVYAEVLQGGVIRQGDAIRDGNVMTTSAEEEIVWTTCPRDCYDACGIQVVKRGGVILKVMGDPRHPHNRGTLCGKCTLAYNGAWRDPARASPASAEARRPERRGAIRADLLGRGSGYHRRAADEHSGDFRRGERRADALHRDFFADRVTAFRCASSTRSARPKWTRTRSATRPAMSRWG